MVALPASKVSRFLLLFLFLNGSAVQASQSPGEAKTDAVRWLERMNRSVATLSYEGRFVYLSGKSLEAMHIRHRIIDGKPRESLLSLNGIPREVIRENHTLTITTRIDGKVHKTQHPSTGKLLPLKSLEPHGLQDHYRIVAGKLSRIAGRYGMVVSLLPRDDLRYGYRLVLDNQSALPLDLTVMDSSGELVSRIMFTQLQVGGGSEPEPAELPKEETSDEGPQRVAASLGPNDAQHENPAPAERMDAVSSLWQFSKLPPGFELIGYRRLGESRQEHFVFSDGLATISAYLEPLKEGDTPFEGEARLGSINALGRHLQGQQLTVIGEVPNKTLRLLAGALQRKE